LDDIHLAELRKQIPEMLSEWREGQPVPAKRPVVATVMNDKWELQAA
jgi:hypothetical protein